MAKTLNFEFNLDSGKLYTMKIEAPLDSVTKTTAQALADKIINAKFLLVNGSYATSLKSVYTRTVSETALE